MIWSRGRGFRPVRSTYHQIEVKVDPELGAAFSASMYHRIRHCTKRYFLSEHVPTSARSQNFRMTACTHRLHFYVYDFKFTCTYQEVSIPRWKCCKNSRAAQVRNTTICISTLGSGPAMQCLRDLAHKLRHPLSPDPQGHVRSTCFY